MPINLGGLIKSYQSVGVDGNFSTDVLQSSSADALVPAQRWRVRWSGRNAERSREIGASRRRVDETSRRIFEASEENDEKPEEGRKEGVRGREGATGERSAKSFVVRPCSIPSSRYPAMWYTCRESCCIVSNAKVYPGGKRKMTKPTEIWSLIDFFEREIFFSVLSSAIQSIF